MDWAPRLQLASQPCCAATASGRAERLLSDARIGSPDVPWGHAYHRATAGTKRLEYGVPLHEIPANRQFPAPVAQWIEQRFPKPRAQVRFLPGASFTGIRSNGLRAVERANVSTGRDSRRCFGATGCRRVLSERRYGEPGAPDDEADLASAAAGRRCRRPPRPADSRRGGVAVTRRGSRPVPAAAIGGAVSIGVRSSRDGLLAAARVHRPAGADPR
jgi:hypothetical protein